MKYIRTKDGVYEVILEDDEIEMYQVKRRFASVEYKDVIAKSDFIDELCGFVFAEDKTHNHYLFELKGRGVAFKQRLREWKLDGWFIDVNYCIKSSTCLKFVAKMNDKGELELL